jgi:predicted RND superfamily exporter protein
MAGEELIQRGYFNHGKIKGDAFGRYETMELGSTTANELVKIGVITKIEKSVNFPFKKYKAPKNTSNSKTDAIYLSRESSKVKLLANKEVKKPSEFNTDAKKEKAAEQGLFAGYVLGAEVSIITDGTNCIYIDIKESIKKQKLINMVLLGLLCIKLPLFLFFDK